MTYLTRFQPLSDFVSLQREMSRLFQDFGRGSEELLTSGTWTHDFPITCERGQELGLPVRDDMPENILRLMRLYPQPIRRQPSVEYLPLPYRTGEPGPRK